MSETRIRIISAIVAIPVVLVFIFFDQWWIDVLFYFSALWLLSKELNGFFDCLTAKDCWFATVFIMLGGGLQLYFLHNEVGHMDSELIGLLVFSIFVFVGIHLFKKDFKGVMERLQAIVFNFVFCLFFIFFFFKIKYFYQLNEMGKMNGLMGATGLGHLDNYYLLYAILTAWLFDSFAYLGGKAFGTKTLGLSVSPNKTWMGLISGLLFSYLSFMIVGFLVKEQFPLLFKQTFFTNWGLGIVVTVILAMLSQFGDLMGSLMKRSIGVKDSGAFLKGHGGFIDRIDSLLPTVVFFYYYLKYLN